MNNTARNMKEVSLFVIFSVAFVLLNAAWIDNYPLSVTQTDGTEVDVFITGDEFHRRVHDGDGFTIIQDDITSEWCWAKLENNNIVSTGFPIHLYSPMSLNLQSGVNISSEKYQQMRSTNEMEQLSRYITPTTGKVNQLIIFIRFSDQTEFGSDNPIYNASWYHDLFNKTGVGVNSMRQYFREASYYDNNGNGLDLESHFYSTPNGVDIFSFQADKKSSYYSEDYDKQALLKLAIADYKKYLPANLSASDFDKDDDGYIDNIVFIMRGTPDSKMKSNVLWPHRGWLSDGNGQLFGKKDIIYNVQIETMLQSRDFRESGGVGLLAHEFGHSLGALDLYTNKNPELNPIVNWCVMGNQTNPPQSFSAHIKEKFKWIDIPLVIDTGKQTLSPLSTNKKGSAIKILCGQTSREYFVVEYRKKEGMDKMIPDSGLIIYRVNQDVEGNNSWKTINGYPHYELYAYRPNGTVADSGYVKLANFSAQSGRTAINNNTNPRPFLSNNNDGGLNISNIGPAGDNTITFMVNDPPKTTKYAYDLAAVSITGPSTTFFKAVECTVKVQNRGSEKVNSALVCLGYNGEKLAHTIISNFASEGSQDFKISWLPKKIGSYDIYGYIDYGIDEVPGNNRTVTMTVNVTSVKNPQVTTNQSLVDNKTYFSNIKDAIGACADGGTVTVNQGRYYFDESVTLPAHKTITIEGVGLPVIDCNNRDGFRYYLNNDKNIVRGIKIVNASTAIYINGGYPVLKDIVICDSDRIIDIKYSYPDCGALIEGCEFTFKLNLQKNKDHGIVISNGNLRISDSKINIENAYLYLAGDNSINFDSKSVVTTFNGLIELADGAMLSFDNSNINVANGTIKIIDSSLELTSGSTAHFNYSKLIMTDGELDLKNRSTVSFSNKSWFETYGNSVIKGHTPKINIEDQSSDWDLDLYSVASMESNLALSKYDSGDRIVFNNSFANLRKGTVVTTSRSDNGKWDGIYFYNNTSIPKSTSLILSDISNIQNLVIDDCEVAFGIPKSTSDATKVTNIDSFVISQGANVYLYNTIYKNNSRGILVKDADLFIRVGSLIQNNGGYGVKLDHLSSYLDTFNSEFSGNLRVGNTPGLSGHGIVIENGRAQIRATSIFNNKGHGIFSTSNVVSSVTDNSKIYNNKGTEVSALLSTFIKFSPTSVNSKLYDNNPNDGTADDLYLVMGTPESSLGKRVMPEPEEFIVLDRQGLLFGLDIALTNPARFYPSLSAFGPFPPTFPKYTSPFDPVFDYISEGMFTEAEIMLKEIIAENPGTTDAENALSLLPFVVCKSGGDLDELLLYNASIEDDFLEYKKIETVARVNLIREDYLAAILEYEKIISEISLEVNARLLAELEQAYCYLLLAENNTRGLLPKVTRMPKDPMEYLNIRDEIMNKLQNSAFGINEPGETIPEVTQYSLSNYPNPFNPETTIQFGVSSNSELNAQSASDGFQRVTIDIFNIKGQKVRALVNGEYAPGKHSVVWNGRDDNGVSVGSGIYFYRMNAADFSATKKMVLIK